MHPFIHRSIHPSCNLNGFLNFFENVQMMTLGREILSNMTFTITKKIVRLLALLFLLFIIKIIMNAFYFINIFYFIFFYFSY